MMTERDTEQTTDGYQFRWWLEWRETDAVGALREYTALRIFEGAEQLSVARAEHTADCRGGWVQPGMIEPHVSALRVQEKGRLLLEELAPKRDVDPVATQPALA